MIKKIYLIIIFITIIAGIIYMIKINITWDKTFKKDKNVIVKKIKFKNRFGITIAADLYTPKNIKKEDRLPAIAISGPFGAVKEQASGLYAQALAKKGYITLAFDPSYTGESSGKPRNVASSDINTEDFSAAVDYLINHKNVNPQKIGILGICGFGGFAINAAQIDTRIKATVASTMYNMTRVSANGYNDSLNKEEKYKLKQALNNQRTIDFKRKKYAHADSLLNILTGKEPQFVVDYYNYYKTKRGFHKNSINSNKNWNKTSALTLINSQILTQSDEIESAILLIHGENAHSRYFSEDVFKNLKGKNKKLLIIKNANHTDLYDNLNKIPFDEIDKFYMEYLK